MNKNQEKISHHVKEPNMKSNPAWIKGMEKKTGKSFKPEQVTAGVGDLFAGTRPPEQKEVICLDCYAHNINDSHVCDPLMKILVEKRLKNTPPKECDFGCEDPFYGKNNTCPVHNTPPKEDSWEDEYDKKFNNYPPTVKNLFALSYIKDQNEFIKSFIRYLLSEAREKAEFWEEEAKRFSQNSDFHREAQAQTLARVRDKIEKMKEEWLYDGTDVSIEYSKGYVKSLQDILAILNEK